MYFGLDELVLVSISVATATLGIVAYHRAPDRVWNRLFTVHAFAVSLWVLLNVLIQCASTVADAGVWIRLCHPVVAVVICTCVDLFWVFPERVELETWPKRGLFGRCRCAEKGTGEHAYGNIKPGLLQPWARRWPGHR